jgi:hypothetical protein
MSGSGIHSDGFIAWLSTIYRSTTVPGSRRVLESPLLVGDKHSVGAAERLGGLAPYSRVDDQDRPVLLHRTHECPSFVNRTAPLLALPADPARPGLAEWLTGLRS